MMQLPDFQLPNLSRIRIVTEYDDMVVALDKKKREISEEVFDKPLDERMKVADQLAEICEQQAPLGRKAQEVRAAVVVLAEMGAYWLVLESLMPEQAAHIKKAIEPTVQKMRDASAEAETVQ